MLRRQELLHASFDISSEGKALLSNKQSEEYVMSIHSQTKCRALSQKNARLDRVRKSIAECALCPLATTRNSIVFGAGNKNADVMLCGEAPGKNEDEGGLPFVGAAGKRLDALLEVAGLEREDIFIANVVKCRPPKNRDPRPEEIKACSPFLGAQIEAIKPRILVTLGTFSSQCVLNTKKSITELRGNFFTRSNAQNTSGQPGSVVTVFPVFHPAAAIYDPKKQTALENDFKTLRTWLKEHP